MMSTETKVADAVRTMRKAGLSGQLHKQPLDMAKLCELIQELHERIDTVEELMVDLADAKEQPAKRRWWKR